MVVSFSDNDRSSSRGEVICLSVRIWLVIKVDLDSRRCNVEVERLCFLDLVACVVYCDNMKDRLGVVVIGGIGYIIVCLGHVIGL